MGVMIASWGLGRKSLRDVKLSIHKEHLIDFVDRFQQQNADFKPIKLI